MNSRYWACSQPICYATIEIRNLFLFLANQLGNTSNAYGWYQVFVCAWLPLLS